MPTTFMKSRRVDININTSEISSYEGKEKQILEAYEKIPYNSDVIDSDSLSYYLSGKVGDYINKYAKTSDVLDKITKYFKGLVTYKEYRDCFDEVLF